MCKKGKNLETVEFQFFFSWPLAPQILQTLTPMLHLQSLPFFAEYFEYKIESLIFRLFNEKTFRSLITTTKMASSKGVQVVRQVSF